MFFQAPQRCSDSYKCGARSRKSSTHTRKFVCLQTFHLRMSTRSFNFNWVNRFINCVFTQIRSLSVSLKYAMERCTCTRTNKYMWTWIQNRKVFGGWSDLHPVSPCRVMLVHIQKSTAITNTKVAQVLWPLYRDFHHKALYSVLQKQLQAALNALLQKTVTDVSRKKQT